MLKLQRVSASIAGITVLREIDVSLPPGQLLAVVGRNGAGKTTLLRAIMGLLPIAAGRITLDGIDLGGAPGHRRTALGIGYAPEDRVIYPAFTVEENLRLPCEVLGLSTHEIAQRLDRVLDVVPQLAPMLARSGAALSGGQGKMAALGRALMVGTRFVLLDEPFQGLAPVLANQYAESLRRLHQSDPALCIMVTESNRSLMRDLPDTTLTLERGELQSETPETP